MHRDKNQRHTVPNSNYPSFPFYQEEIKLKTNLRDLSDNVDTNQKNNIEFSMQDKLKMCFTEMQNLKDHFDNRRRQSPSKKKIMIQDQNKERGECSKLIASKNIQPNKNSDDNDNKFKAHLVRTRSKDSIDETHENLNEFSGSNNSPLSDIYKGSGVVNNSQTPHKRAVSDPFNLIRTNEQFVPNIFGSKSCEPSQAKMERSQKELGNKKQGFNEWLNKLEEINDMSRSTIERIKRLENDIFTLRNSTEKQLSRSSPETYISSKIPVTPAGYIPNTNRIIKRTVDKSLNTEIDMEFMTKLLKYWESRMNEPKSPQQIKDHSSLIRRMTTTISRSVQIQTDSEKEKLFEDKGIVTDDTINYNNQPKGFLSNQFEDIKSQEEKPKETDEISILDLPIVEKPMLAKNINTFHICGEKFNDKSIESNVLINVETPEPIVEVYSDSDDTNFEDFEKNIFSEISRRALIRNKIVSKSQTNFYNESPKTKLRNSSTQTNKMDNHHKTVNTDKNINEETPEKKVHSTSKIVIERIRSDQKEKKEIIIQTDIEKSGKVRRTTEIRNSKQKFPTDLIKIQNEWNGIECDETNDTVEESQNPVTQVKQIFPRAQSAFDLFENNVLTKNDDFLSNKAFSSLDISSKSPVASEGYHSEQMDSQRLSTPQNYLIEPPESFRGTPEGLANSISPKTSFVSSKKKNNLWIMNNETLIENVGNEMNITTKSSTKQKPMESYDSNIITKKESMEKGSVLKKPTTNLHSEKLIDLNYNDSLVEEKNTHFQSPFKNNELPNGCKLSVIYNYGTNVVFRADFGISQLPLYETNL